MLNTKKLAGALVLSGALFALNSCKDDPTPNSAISFEKSEEATTESDGTVKSFHPLIWQSYANQSGATGTATGREFKVKLVLDRPVAETTVINYTLSGTAKKNSASAIGDFDVDGTTLTIDKGASEAYITLTLFEDFNFFEFNDNDDLFKTVIITLGSVVSGPATISTTNNVYTLTINEDDLFIALEWNVDSSGKATTTALDVDMDMLLWAGSSLTGIGSSYSQTADKYSSKVGVEYFSIPGGFPNATYGLSHIYYSGTATSLPFYVLFMGKVGSTTYSPDKPLVKSQTYSNANINKYDDATVGKTPQIVQTIVKNGLNFTTVSDISLPSSGSRMSESALMIFPKKSSFNQNTFRQFGIF